MAIENEKETRGLKAHFNVLQEHIIEYMKSIIDEEFKCNMLQGLIKKVRKDGTVPNEYLSLPIDELFDYMYLGRGLNWYKPTVFEELAGIGCLDEYKKYMESFSAYLDKRITVNTSGEVEIVTDSEWNKELLQCDMTHISDIPNLVHQILSRRMCINKYVSFPAEEAGANVDIHTHIPGFFSETPGIEAGVIDTPGLATDVVTPGIKTVFISSFHSSVLNHFEEAGAEFIPIGLCSETPNKSVIAAKSAQIMWFAPTSDIAAEVAKYSKESEAVVLLDTSAIQVTKALILLQDSKKKNFDKHLSGARSGFLVIGSITNT